MGNPEASLGHQKGHEKLPISWMRKGAKRPPRAGAGGSHGLDFRGVHRAIYTGARWLFKQKKENSTIIGVLAYGVEEGDKLKSEKGRRE